MRKYGVQHAKKKGEIQCKFIFFLGFLFTYLSHSKEERYPRFLYNQLTSY